MRISDWSSDVCSSDLAVLDRGIDAGEILIHDAAGADVHVPDLGIAQLTIGQTDEAACGMDQRVREIGRASCRERECQYVSIVVVTVSLKKNELCLSH